MHRALKTRAPETSDVLLHDDIPQRIPQRVVLVRKLETGREIRRARELARLLANDAKNRPHRGCPAERTTLIRCCSDSHSTSAAGSAAGEDAGASVMETSSLGGDDATGAAAAAADFFALGGMVIATCFSWLENAFVDGEDV